jgi:hypothetical protein
MVFVSNNQPPEVLKPEKQTFNFLSTPITSDLSTILGRRLFAPATIWRNHFNATLLEKLLIKAIAIIGFIANNLIRSIPSKTTVDSCLYKFYFMERSVFHMSGEWKTITVSDSQDLDSFAALCLADSKTFYAGAKLPSINASRMSILPRL